MFFEVEKSEFVITIRLKRFENFDGASFENQEILAKFFREICFDDTVRTVVLILDSEEKLAKTDEKEKLKILQNICEPIKICRVPVILAVKGKVNLELAEAAHFVRCVRNGGIRFVRKKTRNRFNDEKINSREALKLGLINKIASVANVEKEAYSIAKEISKLAPLAIRACVQAVTQGLEMSLEDGLKLETRLFSEMFSSEDMREGTRAFLEKRKPVFEGK